MHSLKRQVVFVVTLSVGKVSELAALLAQVDLVHIKDEAALLREAYSRQPAVVVFDTAAKSVRIAEVLPLLRERAELLGTYWLAVGTADLEAFINAGADAFITDVEPIDRLVQQIKAFLHRSSQYVALKEQFAQAQRQIKLWEQEERTRDQLIHMLVHDLKNPIAAVMGLLEVVGEDQRVPGDLLELVNVAHEEAQHLLHLAVNILDVRKIQAGKMHLRTELLFSTAFEEIIEHACRDVGSGLRDRQMYIDVAHNLGPTRADPEILRRVLANLISNAMKHTSTGGQIRVQVHLVNNEIHIIVSDNGEGIPAEDLPNLFAAFEQSRLTLHGRFDTGMGLAFCKLAVEQHGGRIWVESERGVGSTFTLTLPSARDVDDEDYVELLS